jgi:hypothetical protein
LLEKGITTRRIIYFGICLGLAPAAKYIGALHMVMLAAAAIGIFRLSARDILLTAAAAIAVFALVFVLSIPVSGTLAGVPELVAQGLGREMEAVVAGRENPKWFTTSYGLTHFWSHLRPVLTDITLVIALALVGTAIKLRDARVILFGAFALIFLIAIELSPLKILRYVLPVAVYLMLAAGIAAARLSDANQRFAVPILMALGVAAASAATAGAGYVANLDKDRDTRVSAIQFLTDQGISNFVQDFAPTFPGVRYARYPDLSGYDYFISIRSSSAALQGPLPDPNDRTYRRIVFFRCLSKYQIAEFSRYFAGMGGTVAPRVRVYDLRNAQECK